MDDLEITVQILYTGAKSFKLTVPVVKEDLTILKLPHPKTENFGFPRPGCATLSWRTRRDTTLYKHVATRTSPSAPQLAQNLRELSITSLKLSETPCTPTPLAGKAAKAPKPSIRMHPYSAHPHMKYNISMIRSAVPSERESSPVDLYADIGIEQETQEEIRYRSLELYDSPQRDEETDTSQTLSDSNGHASGSTIMSRDITHEAPPNSMDRSEPPAINADTTPPPAPAAARRKSRFSLPTTEQPSLDSAGLSTLVPTPPVSAPTPPLLASTPPPSTLSVPSQSPPHPDDAAAIDALTHELADTRAEIAAALARETALAAELRRLHAPVPEAGLPSDLLATIRLQLLEVELARERARRMEVEDALSDVRRECKTPFVVPALFDAFMEIAKLTTMALQ